MKNKIRKDDIQSSRQRNTREFKQIRFKNKSMLNIVIKINETMLPHISAEENIPPVGRKVYINPNFRSPVVNVVQRQGHNSNDAKSWERPAIHINPYFLERQQQFQLHQMQQLDQSNVTYYQQTVAAQMTPPPAKIISKANTCLIRKPPVKVLVTAPTSIQRRVQAPLVSISKQKLVRQGSTLLKSTTAVASPTKAPTTVDPVAKRTKYKLVRSISLTGHSTTPLIKKHRSTRDFVARYALRRTNSVNGKKLSLESHSIRPGMNKSLSMVSIHGVMYKKTAKNKLTKLEAIAPAKKNVQSQVQKASSSSMGRTLFVRGTKFVLDPSGCRLTRVPAQNLQQIGNKSRIDIGGLTYVSSPKAQNVFIRTSNHVSRAHLMTAKHRSLQLLNRSLVKTNVPCAIYQRLGKCAAHSRGKCRRVHDKRQVAICPSFLRGECTKTECLLSHNVSLEKMPVCRFFLRGVCMREDCPYLHKKLSGKAEICIDFLHGYCERAADCNMRHEFVCPEFARRGKCEVINCIYCKKMNLHKLNADRREPKAKPNLEPKMPDPKSSTKQTAKCADDEKARGSRYFKCETNTLQVNESACQQEDAPEDEPLDDGESPAEILRGRPKLGQLPAFIPLGGSD